MKHCILIPTYNNAETLLSVVSSASQYAEHVIVVNDGSTDHTAELASRLPSNAEMISLPKNQGKGGALIAGFRRAAQLGFDYAVSMDSDGQHFAEDTPSLVSAIDPCKRQIILGSRNIEAENMPEKNTFANKFSNFWFKVETGYTLPDTQCGFRAYPVKEMNKMHIFSSRYEAELEMLVRLCWDGVEPVPVQVRVYYPPKEERISHFRPFWDFARISVLNTVLCLITLLYVKPRNLLRRATA